MEVVTSQGRNRQGGDRNPPGEGDREERVRADVFEPCRESVAQLLSLQREKRRAGSLGQSTQKVGGIAGHVRDRDACEHSPGLNELEPGEAEPVATYICDLHLDHDLDG